MEDEKLLDLFVDGREPVEKWAEYYSCSVSIALAISKFIAGNSYFSDPLEGAAKTAMEFQASSFTIYGGIEPIDDTYRTIVRYARFCADKFTHENELIWGGHAVKTDDESGEE